MSGESRWVTFLASCPLVIGVAQLVAQPSCMLSLSLVASRNPIAALHAVETGAIRRKRRATGGN